MLNSVNMRSLEGSIILIIIWDPKLANFCNEMDAWQIDLRGVVVCLQKEIRKKHMLPLCDIIKMLFQIIRTEKMCIRE